MFVFVAVKGDKTRDLMGGFIEGVFSTEERAKRYAETQMNSWWEYRGGRGDWYHYWRHGSEYWAVEGWEVDAE